MNQEIKKTEQESFIPKGKAIQIPILNIKKKEPATRNFGINIHRANRDSYNQKNTDK